MTAPGTGDDGAIASPAPFYRWSKHLLASAKGESLARALTAFFQRRCTICHRGGSGPKRLFLKITSWKNRPPAMTRGASEEIGAEIRARGLPAATKTFAPRGNSGRRLDRYICVARAAGRMSGPDVRWRESASSRPEVQLFFSVSFSTPERHEFFPRRSASTKTTAPREKALPAPQFRVAAPRRARAGGHLQVRIRKKRFMAILAAKFEHGGD